MNETQLRNTIIDILDDEDGINVKAWNGIQALCDQYGWSDIFDIVECTDDRYYLGEDDAETLRLATGEIAGQ